MSRRKAANFKQTTFLLHKLMRFREDGLKNAEDFAYITYGRTLCEFIEQGEQGRWRGFERADPHLSRRKYFDLADERFKFEKF